MGILIFSYAILYSKPSTFLNKNWDKYTGLKLCFISKTLNYQWVERVLSTQVKGRVFTLKCSVALITDNLTFMNKKVYLAEN